MTGVDVAGLLDVRVREPERIAALAAARARPSGLVGVSGRLLLVAADHPARGVLRVGPDAMAMADRALLLGRLVAALGRPGVDGVLATADILEDLLLLGALEGKVVIGSMNRGGLAGTVFEIDDRFTGCTPEGIEAAGWQGGKMLLRIDPDDPSTVRTLESCARAVDALAQRRLMAMVEPFISRRTDHRVTNDLSTASVVRSACVAAGLGTTSAHTWLKLPVVDDMSAVLEASTLPVLLLGGEVAADQDAQMAQMAQWRKALASPSVRGMVVGRSLLFPPDGDVVAAVDATVEML